MNDLTIDLRTVPLRLLVDICCSSAKAKGFHEGGAPVGARIDQKLMLVVGELAEAQEELRAGHAPTDIYFTSPAGETLVGVVGKSNDDLAADGYKPEGFPIELADAIVRLFDLAGSLGIDLEAAVQTKLTYNLTRPYKHGRVF